MRAAGELRIVLLPASKLSGSIVGTSSPHCKSVLQTKALSGRTILMGRGSREKPTRLGKKLAQIRSHLGVSQDGLVRKFGLSGSQRETRSQNTSEGYESLALSVLLKYARAAEVNVEVLIDDDLELPPAFVRRTNRRGGVAQVAKGTKRKKT